MLKKNILAIFALSLVMFACGGGKEDDNSNVTPDPDPTTGLVIGIEGSNLPANAVIVLGKDLIISDITEASAKASAVISKLDTKDPITEYGFNLNKAGATEVTAFKGGAITTAGEVKIDLTGLAEETDYEVKFFVKTAKGTANHPSTAKFKTTKKDTPPPVYFHDQRVLIEEFTGAWCGWCPRGLFTMNSLVDKDSSHVFGAAIHYGDGMENQILYRALNNTYNVPGFPSGMVNRVNYGGYVQDTDKWSKATSNQLTKNGADRTKPELGVAINTELSGSTLKGKITVNFREKRGTTGYKLVIYLLEDGITGYPQANYLQGMAEYKDTPYYSLPDPINDFVHDHVVRKVLTSSTGEEIPKEFYVPGGNYEYEFEADLSRYKAEKCSIIAFVTDGSSKPYIVNVNKTHAGSSVNF